MSWRVVVISKRSKLDFKMGFLMVRNEEGEKRIFIDDISVLLIESTAVSLTTYLMVELISHKVKVVFCDHKHNPAAEIMPMYGSYISSGRIKQQLGWSKSLKGKVWKEIIRQKISKQAEVLRKTGNEVKAVMLEAYMVGVMEEDKTNREGHAAKVYFNALFGNDFYRDNDDVRNNILDYGYSVLLAAFNREVAANGYLTQLGIWHEGATNPFNLGCDLMEPFRPIIDLFAAETNFNNFGTDEKRAVLDILNSEVKIKKERQYLNNAIGVYARSVFAALEEGDIDKILEYEL